jgi:hypothetical protein
MNFDIFFLFTESDLFNVRVVDVLPPSLLSDIIDRDRISTNNKKEELSYNTLVRKKKKSSQMIYILS